MKLRRLAALMGAAFAVCPAAASAAQLTHSESSLLSRMNIVRRAHGLRPLREDRRLEAAARFHSREMISSGAFTHGAFGARMARFDVTGRLAGENLAWGVGSDGSPSLIVREWLASPEHRANLLRPSFSRVGIANLLGSFEGFADARVVTADFAG